MTSNPQAWLLEAQAHQSAGRNAEALEAYQRFLAAQPGHAGAWADLGGLLMNQERLPEALEACERALGLDASLPFAWVNLAGTRMRLGQLQEAEGLFLRLLARNPRELEARLGLAECLLRKGDLEEAVIQLGKVLHQEPQNLPAFRKMLFAQVHRGDWNAQYSAIAQRLDAVPNCQETRMDLGILDLLRGVLPKGWDEFESRFSLREQVVSLMGTFSQPLWEGQPFPGRTLLLHWEQGFGDTLMFIRYAALAKARGGRVLVLAQAALAELVATCPGVDEVIPHGQPLPPFDLQLPLMSLPRVFRTDLSSIPAEVPYLELPKRVPNRACIAQVLAASEGRVRIGYAWAGRAEHLNDHQRSMPPERLAPLAALPGVAWHSFQVPMVENPALPGVPLGPLLSNFSDTAYALSGMDLVITVDTALAHAAGALGIPTFLMLAHEPDWRWLLERDDSPWYPSLRLYRQSAPGDWGSVIGSILKDLREGIDS